jgi:hypothetical protein
MEYVEFGIAGEATVTKAEVDKWFSDLLKISQRSYVLRLQFKGLSFLPAVRRALLFLVLVTDAS